MGICGSFQIRFALSQSHGKIFISRVIPGLNRFSSLLSITRCLPLGQINAALSLGISYEDLRENFDVDSPTSGKEMNFSSIRVPIFLDNIQKNDNLMPTMLSMGASIFIGQTPTVALAKALNFVSLYSFTDEIGQERLGGEDIHDITMGGERLLKVVQQLAHGNMESDLELNSAILPLINEIVSISSRLRDSANGVVPDKLIRDAKVLGFSNAGIANIAGLNRNIISQKNDQESIYSHLISIGRDADEEENKVCFVSYASNFVEEEFRFAKKKAREGSYSLLFLGTGPYRIGWGSEIDQTLLKTTRAFKNQGHRIYMINNNPDSVSLDPSVMDGICLEIPTLEAIQSVLDKWSIDGLVHQFCPNIPEGLEDLLKSRRVSILGTPLKYLRKILSIPTCWKILEEIGIPLKSHSLVTEPTRAFSEANILGYPILVRLTHKHLNPEAGVMYDDAMLQDFLDLYGRYITKQTPLFIEKFMEGMISGKVLAMADGQEATALAFIGNIEEYGVHSGDCASIIPILSLGDFHKAVIEEALRSIVSHFNIVGYLHMDFAISGRSVYVTGLWPYPSRNIPLFEKSMTNKIDKWISKVLLGSRMGELGISTLPKSPGRFYVKESSFEYFIFPDLDPILSPRMTSTGQVLGSDYSFGKAYLKSQMAINPKIPDRGKVFISVRDSEKEAVLQISKKLLQLGFTIVSTQGTAQFFAERGIDVVATHKVSKSRPNIIDLIKNGETSLVINIPGGLRSKTDEQIIHRAAIEQSIPLVTTISGAFLMVRGLEEVFRSSYTFTPLEL